MAEVVRIPQMEGLVIFKWLKKEGDKVSVGEALVEVETIKLIAELDSYQDGVLLHIVVKEKESVPAGGILAVIGEEGEDFQHLLKEVNKPEGKKDSSKSLGSSNIDNGIIRMPKMHDFMEEGVVLSWLKKEGDEVSSGDILAKLQSDTVTWDMESYKDGVVLYIGVNENEPVSIGDILAIIGEKGEDFHLLLNAENKKEERKSTSKNEVALESVNTNNINASIIRMPRVSNVEQEVMIITCLKNQGDKVKSGDILVEGQACKTFVELKVHEDGILLYMAVKESDIVAVGSIIAVIGEVGADYQALIDAEESGSTEQFPKK